mmetsp:Transcript_22395/g.50467  ORF Transcript_22395/g.50467 Transcript_22395/m.50467 type:complete len:214 (-) Transcript_22395:186-827(-)
MPCAWQSWMSQKRRRQEADLLTLIPLRPPLIRHPSMVKSPHMFSTAQLVLLPTMVRLHSRASEASSSTVAELAAPHMKSSGISITMSSILPTPMSCTRLRTAMASLYRPASTRITSPSLAESIASCMSLYSPGTRKTRFLCVSFTGCISLSTIARDSGRTNCKARPKLPCTPSSTLALDVSASQSYARSSRDAIPTALVVGRPPSQSLSLKNC